uniref:Putative secreted protein n=1 Tax=Anopheles darlingi TaxID=43151 RepID=A0A2M4D6Z9_ANODA
MFQAHSRSLFLLLSLCLLLPGRGQHPLIPANQQNHLFILAAGRKFNQKGTSLRFDPFGFARRQQMSSVEKPERTFPTCCDESLIRRVMMTIRTTG